MPPRCVPLGLGDTPPAAVSHLVLSGCRLHAPHAPPHPSGLSWWGYRVLLTPESSLAYGVPVRGDPEGTERFSVRNLKIAYNPALWREQVLTFCSFPKGGNRCWLERAVCAHLLLTKQQDIEYSSLCYTVGTCFLFDI